MAMSSVFEETTYKTYCNITIQNQILLKWDLSLFWLRLWKTAVTHKLNYNKIQNNIILVMLVWSIPLRKKRLCSEFFWSIFSCIWFEICKSPYSVRIRGKKHVREKYWYSDWIRTRKAPNTDTFHAVYGSGKFFFRIKKLSSNLKDKFV